MTIQPNGLFTVWRPDEVAECLNGVPMPIYQALWDLVNEYKDKRTNEQKEEPTPGVDALADFWDRLSPDDQTKLNELAEANQRQLEAWSKEA